MENIIFKTVNNTEKLNQLENQVYNQFSINETSKENYLKFKEEIKKESHLHYFYIAYYIFKHRIGRDPETNLVNNQVIEKYLDEVVIPACYKGLYHGRIYPYCGGDCVNTAIKEFKRQVRYIYNQYADSELVEQYQKLKKEQWK